MDLSKYDYVICDIDETLLTGWYPKLMDLVWNLTKSVTISRFMMKLQQEYKLYSINKEVYKMLLTANHIDFVTARSPYVYTNLLLYDMFKFEDIDIHELASYDPGMDKLRFIRTYCLEDSKIILIDDNKDIRRKCSSYVTKVVNPKLL